MRKIKLFLSLLMLIAFSVGNVWATDVSFKFSTMGSTGWASGYAQHSTTCTDGTITFVSASKQTGTITDYPVTKGNPVTFVLSDNTKSLSSVSFTCRQWGSKAQTITLHYSTNSGSTYTSTEITSTNFSISSSSLPTGTNAVKITFSSTSNQVGIESMSYTLAEQQQQTIPVTSVGLDETSITLNEDETQTLTATVLPGDATNKSVTWTSDDEDVATVADGVVTAVGAGDAVITCTSVADNTKSATCNVHVNSPYTKSKLIFEDEYKDSGATADDGSEWTVTSDGTESVYDGTSGIHYGTNNANVTYVQLATSDITGEVAKVVVNARDAQATATISVTVGGTAFTCASATATNTSADYVFTGTGSGEIVVRVDRGSSKSKAIYVKSVVVSYTPAAIEVKKPTFSVEAGSYLGAQSIELGCTTDNAEIYYTLNGEDPDENSTHYEGTAIQVSTTTTIKAIAFLGTTPSPIATATYTIINTEHAGTVEDPYSVADAKAVIDGIGTKEDAYVSGKISQVDSYDSNHNSITYWISADGTTANQLKVYSGKGIGGADFSSVDDVVAKATVVVKGTLMKYGEIYEFNYNNELVSYTEPVDPTVTLSPSSLNLEAEGNGTQEITLTATNFENEVNEITCAFYNTAACDGEAISQPAWITSLTDNNSNQVSFDVEDNDGDARQVWMKVTASDGTDEASAVLAISQAKYTVDYATLPFAYDGNGSEELPNGFTNSGVGTYSSSPAMKFDGTGDYIVIKINAAPGTLTYDIKGNSFSDGTFKVQQSVDGIVYNDIETYTELGTIQNESKTLAAETRYVKFIYTEKVNGNVALGNIAISEYVAPVVKPTITTQPEGAEYTINDPAAALTIVAEAGNGGTLHYQWYSNTTQSTEGASTIGTDAATYTPSTDALGTIYYYCVVAEDGADEPTTSNIVAVAVSESMPATVTYELFSGDLVEGDYVIYYSDGAMNTTVESDRLQYAEVTPTEDKITNPDASIIWHIAQSGEYWTIYNSAADSYAASTGAKNKAQMLADGTDDKALWTVSGDATYEFVNKKNTTNGVNANLRKNGTYGFACYSSTQSGTGPLTLYKKKIEGQPATPTFSISGGTYTSAQEVTISCATEEVAIYYTTDGITNPTSESTLYEGPISVNETMTIKAIAIKNEIASDVASATYTIVAIEHAGTEVDPYTIADARNAILVGGDLSEKYVSGIISQIDSYSSQYHSITYWISDDGETTSPQLQVYSGKGLNGADFSSVNDVAVKATVIVKGTLKKHNDTYEFDYNNELVSYAAPAVPTVTLKQSGSAIAELNVEAANVVNQAIDVECTHFADAISSVTAKLYSESTCENEITSGAWVTDITVNGAKDQVTFNVADNTGASRQVWMKVTASDDSDDAYAVLAISQAKSAYATMPFAFDGGKNDVVNTNGMSHSGLGSDYAASPKLKFDNTDDYLIIKINEDPGKLTYDIKNNSFSGGTFTVQESADGETYTNVASHTEITDTQSEEVDLKQATRYVKFIYTEKVTGNVGLGNITISKYVAPDYGSYERDGLTAGNYATICLPNSGTIDGAKLFDIEYYDGINTLYLLEVNGNAMVAGRPYIFLPEADEITVTYTNDANASAGSFNGLVGSYSQQNVNEIAGENYILYQNAYYLVNSTAYVGANRAYIHMDGVPTEPSTPQVGQAPRRRVTMAVHGEQVATGIDALNASDAPAKVLINGQLFIIRGEKMFDAKGQLVK